MAWTEGLIGYCVIPVLCQGNPIMELFQRKTEVTSVVNHAQYLHGIYVDGGVWEEI